MRPAFRRGWEGEGKPNRRPWRGPAGAQRPPHGGGYSALGTRGQSPWRSHAIRRTEASASRSRIAAQERRPRTARRRRAAWRRAERTTRPLRKAQRRQSQRARERRPFGKERGESASGSARKRRALRSAKRGTERVPESSRSFFGRPSLYAPDSHPEGRDYRLGRHSRYSGLPKGQREKESMEAPTRLRGKAQRG